jgi:hypothetical protein
MKKTAKIALAVGAIALGATAAYAAAAPAQNQQQTPKNWSWTPGKDPKQRVERPAEVTTNPDGSTREVITKGRCVTVKEKLADGTLKTSSQCNPS